MTSLRNILALALVGSSLYAGQAAAAVTIGTTTYSTPASLGSFAAGSQLAVGDLITNSSTTASLTFYDDFVFTLTAPVKLTELSASLTLVPLASITGFTESLYSGATTVYKATGTNPITSAALGTSTSTAPLSFSSLAAGTYTLQISGVVGKGTSVLGVTIPNAATYGTLVSLAPVTAVPEPGSWALLAAGLLALAALARSRRNLAPSAA